MIGWHLMPPSRKNVAGHQEITYDLGLQNTKTFLSPSHSEFSTTMTYKIKNNITNIS